MSEQQESKKQGKYDKKSPLKKGMIKNNTGPDGQPNWHNNPEPKKINPPKPKRQTPPAKKAPFDTHQQFFESVGWDIFEYARSQGYSVEGSLFLMSLAAQESGYGDATALNKFIGLNNFFGINAGKRKFASEEEGIEYVLDKNKGLIHRLYPKADSLLKEDTLQYSELDKALKGYNLDANGVKYATWLKINDENGVKKRAVDSIPGMLATLEDEMNNIKDSNHLPGSTAIPFFSTDNANAGIINTIQSQIDDLKHLQQELQTGEPINKPFNIPDMPNWNKKKADTNNTQPLGLLFGPSDTNSGQSVWPGAIRYLENPDEGNDMLSAPKGYLGTSSLNDKPPVKAYTSPSIHSISPAHASPPASAKNGGHTGSISFNMHTNDNYTTHTAISKKDIHDEVVAVLTSAVADSKIGTDIP